MKWLHQIHCIYSTVGSTVLELERSTPRPNVYPHSSSQHPITHPKHSAHTLRPTTCVAFGSLLTLDMVTDERGLQQSQKEPSRNSAECQKHLIAAQERLKGYICSALLLVWFNVWTGKLTPAGVWGSTSDCCDASCFMSKRICSMATQNFVFLWKKSIFWQVDFHVCVDSTTHPVLVFIVVNLNKTM